MRIDRCGVPLGVGLAILIGAGLVSAQSPDPTPSTVSGAPASPAPSATAFPWPTIPSHEDEPLAPSPASPQGQPVASVTRHGIRLETWFSPAVATPGVWTQLIVRATNVGRDVARIDLGVCPGDWGTDVSVELTPITPQGIEQTGNAARFKAEAVKADTWEQARAAGFGPLWITLGSRPGLLVRAYAECTSPNGPRQFRRLAPGASRTERFTWGAFRAPITGGPLEPLRPGTVPVTVQWRYGGRGANPTEAEKDRESRTITLVAPLTIEGPGPGTPSFPDLVDIALADPLFRSWVDAAEPAARWEVSVQGVPAGTPIAEGYHGWHEIDAAPNGAVELMLTPRGRLDRDGKLVPPGQGHGAMYLDPWTGTVLGHWFSVPWPPEPDPSRSPSPIG
jgi:hypothetical protein